MAKPNDFAFDQIPDDDLDPAGHFQIDTPDDEPSLDIGALPELESKIALASAMLTKDNSATESIAVTPAWAAAPETLSRTTTEQLRAGERVRFLAAATLRVEGQQHPLDVLISNLSMRGVACKAPVMLDIGSRVWLSFRLNLAESPVGLLCEVLWRRATDSVEATYGLRFAGLTREESIRVELAVRERVEGRAAEWPLPYLPVHVAPPPPTVSRWPMIFLGILIGTALTLAAIQTAPRVRPWIMKAVRMWLKEPPSAATPSAGALPVLPALPTRVEAPPEP